jgi:hypothetical protein
MRSTPAVPDPNQKRDGETATALTDGIMAAQCAFYVHTLGQSQGSSQHAVQFWRGAFAAAGLAAAAGAGYHGLPHDILPGVRAALWKAVGVATGAAGMLLLVGGIWASSAPGRRGWRQVWVAGALLKSVLLGIHTWRRGDFRFVIYDYGSSLAALLGLQRWRPGPASRPIGWGVALSFVAAAIQQGGPVLHRHFDKNALYHVMQMVALHCFARAGRRLAER